MVRASIYFWHDRWWDPRLLRNLIHGPLLQDEDNLRLCEVVQAGCFDNQRLSIKLPPTIVRSLPAFLISTREDYMFSSFSKENKFDFNKALLAVRQPRVDADLCWLWKLKLPPKIIFFLWQVWFDRLPHKATLARRNIINSPICPLCSLASEDVHHMFRSYSFSLEVWDLFLMDPVAPPSFHDWLQLHLTYPTDRSTLPWKILFPCILWAIWLRRNELVFNQRSITTDWVKKEALRIAWEYSSLGLEKKTEKFPPAMKWQPAMGATLTLNTDASYINSSSPSGIAGIIRDGEGRWVMGFSARRLAGSALMAELWALWEGLSLVVRHQWHHVTVLSDSALAVNRLNSTNFVKDAYSNRDIPCRELMSQIQGLELSMSPEIATGLLIF